MAYFHLSPLLVSMEMLPLEKASPSNETHSACATQISGELKSLDAEHQSGIRVSDTALLRQDIVLG